MAKAAKTSKTPITINIVLGIVQILMILVSYNYYSLYHFFFGRPKTFCIDCSPEYRLAYYALIVSIVIGLFTVFFDASLSKSKAKNLLAVFMLLQIFFVVYQATIYQTHMPILD